MIQQRVRDLCYYKLKKQLEEHIIEDGFFGQEINHTTYNLARMNMFLHNVNYDKFNIALGDTLINPQFKDEKPFDAIVSNPPYSVNWIGSDDPTLIMMTVLHRQACWLQSQRLILHL